MRLLAILLAASISTMVLAGCSTQSGGADTTLRPTVEAMQTQVAEMQTGSAAKAAVPAMPTLMPAVAGLPTNGTTKGDPNAKVTLTEYTDFQ